MNNCRAMHLAWTRTLSTSWRVANLFIVGHCLIHENYHFINLIELHSKIVLLSFSYYHSCVLNRVWRIDYIVKFKVGTLIWNIYLPNYLVCIKLYDAFFNLWEFLNHYDVLVSINMWIRCIYCSNSKGLLRLKPMDSFGMWWKSNEIMFLHWIIIL